MKIKKPDSKRIIRKSIQKINRYLFLPRWHFSRFHFNIITTFLLAVGFIGGTYFTLNKFWPQLFAANDTYQVWTFDTTNDENYTFNTNSLTILDSGVSVSNKALNSTFDTDLTSWTEIPNYILNDKFDTDTPAGSINGSQASPTGGLRTATDTNSKMSISGGKLNFATGGFGTYDPRISYPSLNREQGRAIITELTVTGFGLETGYGINSTSTPMGILVDSAILYSRSTGYTPNVGSFQFGTTYTVASVMRNSGMFNFIKGGTFTDWTLIDTHTIGNVALNPWISYRSTITVGSVEYIRAPEKTWVPTPLIYDTFTRANGSSGTTEIIGPDSQTTPTLSWSGGNITTNKLTVSPTMGAEIFSDGGLENWITNSDLYYWQEAVSGTSTINKDTNNAHSGLSALRMDIDSGNNYAQIMLAPNPTVGTWYNINLWAKASDAVSSLRIYFNGLDMSPVMTPGTTYSNFTQTSRFISSNLIAFKRATSPNNSIYLDDLSLKPLDLSSLFSTLSTNDSDVIIETNVTMTSGTQAGIVSNLDSTSAPSNFVIAYHDGVNVKLDKVVGGTYTNLISAATTYVPGAPIRLTKVSNKYAVYYNNVIVGAAQMIYDAGIISNTKHGVFSTYSGNSFDNFVIWPRGSSTTKFNDAPFDELTVTRDTVNKYLGGASVKLVASATESNYTQNVNVGDGDSYLISAYAYEGAGQVVDTDDLNLFFDNSVQSTTFTPVGGDWYRMTATITGANTIKNFGVRVKKGKSINLDSFAISKVGNFQIFNTSSYQNLGVSHWDSFSSVENTPLGTSVRYQICTDDGVNCEANITSHWQYYSGGTWNNASNITSDFSSASELTPQAMQLLPTTSKKISVKTILISNGLEFPNVQSITIGLTDDQTNPILNASTIAMKTNNGGSNVSASSWANDIAPYFSWAEGADNVGGSGLRGYCLYLGPDITGDPATSKGLLGISPVDTSYTNCGFIIGTNSIDFANIDFRGNTWLTSSNSEYYLNIKAVDVAGNVYPNLNASFGFKFDNTPPQNVSYTSCASGNFANVIDMNFDWPITGSGSVASDSTSGIAGFQYKIGIDGTWRNLSGSSYNLQSNVDTEITAQGNYVIYFRTKDSANNLSLDSTIRTCNLSYGGAAPTFGGSDFVTITPTDSTTNNFSLTWPAATPTSPQNVTHYYYMVNTTPPTSLSTLQNNSYTYIDNLNELTVSARSLPNVNKGSNTIYVVAIDDVNSYSPSNFISGTFNLDSTDPDNVGNLVGSDSSIKSMNQWNVTLSWTQPVYQGAGNLIYQIYRSQDGISFSLVGSSTGLSYVDNTPTSSLFYYKVVTKDGADAQSTGTNAVTITPTGKWNTAPDLQSEPTAINITTSKATISWSTSRTSDSAIAIGTQSGKYVEDEIGNSSQVTNHEVHLTNLTPGTKYYYIAKWTDEDGNSGQSTERTVTTSPAPIISNVTIPYIGLDNGLIQYTAKGASKVKIYYGKTRNFGGVIEVPTSLSESTYNTQLLDLESGTKYFYKINTLDSDNTEYEGTVLDFTTIPRPKISNVQLQSVANKFQTTILITWESNTDISSVITYYPEGNSSSSIDKVDIKLIKGVHKLQIEGLLPRTRYDLFVKGRDKYGNEAISDKYKFTTSSDTRPPLITNLKVIGGTIPPVGFAAGEVKAQLLITWDTDELSTSQIEFGTGTGENYSQKSQFDGNLSTNHTVILSGLNPSQVYHFRAISNDKSGNISLSTDMVTISPKATRSALDLVLKNLSEAFGFLNSIR